MGLYGAKEKLYSHFGGGVVFDLDDSELEADQSPDAQNVDLDDGESVAKRKGRVAYNSSFAASRTAGVFAYYPRSGDRSLIIAAGTEVRADTNNDGDFGDAGETIASGLTGTTWMDFIQWQNNVYFGNGVDAFRKWTGSGTAAAVTIPAAPSAKPTARAYRLTLEAFTSGAYTATNGALSTAYDTAQKRTDTSSVKVTAASATAKGHYVHKVWSSGATVDLSDLDSITFWAMGQKANLQFQFGVKDNSGVISWAKYPTFKFTRKMAWTRFEVPLGALDQADRDASTGFGIRFVDDDDNDYTLSIWVDDAQGKVALAPGRYQYFYTYAEVDASGDEVVILRESNPKTDSDGDPLPGKVYVNARNPIAGIQVSVTASVESGINRIILYRHNLDGPFKEPRQVQILANATATHTDTWTDAEIARFNTRRMIAYKMSPPLAKTYSVVNGRIFAGNCTVGGTHYPWRVYVSRLGRVEQFSYAETPDDPTTAGWFDLPIRDTIRRIVEYDGTAVIFCDTTVWSVEGSGWDDWTVRLRASVGLAGRNAVLAWSDVIFFLSDDGFRVIAPAKGAAGEWDTWLISEPANSVLRRLPPGKLARACVGMDERQRLHLSYARVGDSENTRSLVFDPQRAGALTPGANPKRRGWSLYTNWGFSCFHQLRRGVVGTGWEDNGQLIAGSETTAVIHYLHRSKADALLETDDGSAVTWYWQSRRENAGSGRRAAWVYVTAHCEPQSGQTLTVTPYLDGAASANTSTLTLAAASGIDIKTKRTAPAVQGQLAAIRIGGSHSVAMKVKALGYGFHARAG